jgi:hypothetical protein
LASSGVVKRVRFIAATSLFSAVIASGVQAQDTRAGLIEAEQAKKAAEAKPYQPTKFEAVFARLEESFVSPPNGFFPVVGKIPQGGGFSLGAGYRHFYARRAVIDVVGLYSVKNYKQVELGTRTPWHGNGRWTLGAKGGWLDAPQVAYYGQGSTEQDDRTSFHLTMGYAALTTEFRPTRWTYLLGEVGYDDTTNKAGSGSHPSIETIFPPADTPGLFTDISFIRTQARAAIDWRPAAGYARRGGYYGVTLTNFADQDDTYSFQRLDGEVIQHLPILRETWVLSVRGRVQTTLDEEDVVPYFLLPQLGSGSTLRGYGTGRFRDRHSILTSAEFRWIVNRMAMDMALFYDAGKVTSRREDLDFEGLKSDWGIGARFHGLSTTVLRLEAARGSDGWRLVVSTNSAF